MDGLDFDIEVVTGDTSAPRRNRKHVAALVAALALNIAAVAVVVVSLHQQQREPVTAPAHARAHRPPAPAPAPAPPPAAAAAAPTAAAPAPVATVATKPPPSPAKRAAVARKAVRAMAGHSEFLHVLERTGATAPEQVEKKIVAVDAPPAENIAAVVDEENVERVMHDRGPAFRSCYERELKTDATLEGVLDISFTINRDGAVRGAKVVALEEADRARTAKLARCVKAVVQRTLFAHAPPGKPVVVSRVVHFRPGA